MTIIIIAVVALLIVIISIALVINLTSEEDSDEIIGSSEETEYIAEYNKRKQKSLTKNIEPLFTSPFKYNVNMADGKHYVHVAMKLVFQDPLAKMFLEARTPLIDDKMITLLKHLKLEDIQTRSGMELLKRKIFGELTAIYPQEFFDKSESKDRTPVKQVLITEFFVQ